MIDLFPWRFIDEIRKLPLFAQPTEELDRSKGLPAYRPVFSALLLYNFTENYKLFPCSVFEAQLKKAYAGHKRSAELLPLFETEAFKARIKAWYQSFMMETFIYLCLVEAIEDKSHEGLVFYDTRHDFKMKYDAAVLIRGMMFTVNAFRGSSASRASTEERRDVAEREAKINTSESAHWENVERQRVGRIAYGVTDEDCIDVNGILLPSAKSINGLLYDIYHGAALVDKARFYYVDDTFRRFRAGDAALR